MSDLDKYRRRFDVRSWAYGVLTGTLIAACMQMLVTMLVVTR
jgi:hypothetical protein